MDYEERARMAEGLSHSVRIKILDMLKERGGGAYLSEIAKEINKNGQFTNAFHTAKGHVLKLHFCDIVELKMLDGKFHVRLLKDVNIISKDYEKKTGDDGV